MKMNNFSILLFDLLLCSSKKKKVDLLKDFFASSSIDDRGWAFSILSNRFEKKIINSKDLKELVTKKTSKSLFDYSYDYVGDLAETISLLWNSKKEYDQVISLSRFMELLRSNNNKKKLLDEIELILDKSNENQRYTILKILTGGLRLGVSNGLLKESLIKYGKRTLYEIDEFWYGFQLPFTDLFNWLDGNDLPVYVDRKQLFNSFMLANEFNINKFNSVSPINYLAEYKWDGIRAQIIFSNNGKIYSRSGDDVTKSFPDINTFDNNYYVIDGELVIKKGGKILSFNYLQKRIGRKKPSQKITNEYPIHFIAYDILFFKDLDCRNLPLFERKKYLKTFLDEKNTNKLSMSPDVKFKDWKDLKLIKESSLNNHIEGVVIKDKNSIYKKGRVVDGWYKWKRKPYSFDFIIMYAQRGHGKRSSFYSDFTFGCWTNDNFQELIPIGKAYSGYTNDDLKKLDLWVRNNTLQRYGPVRSVKPGLVVEISFDNINLSSRHKSGLALRFPRFSRIRWDKPISEVSELKYIKDLIN